MLKGASIVYVFELQYIIETQFYIHTYIHTRARAHARTSVCVHAHVHKHTHIYIHINKCVHTHHTWRAHMPYAKVGSLHSSWYSWNRQLQAPEINHRVSAKIVYFVSETSLILHWHILQRSWYLEYIYSQKTYLPIDGNNSGIQNSNMCVIMWVKNNSVSYGLLFYSSRHDQNNSLCWTQLENNEIFINMFCMGWVFYFRHSLK